MATCEAFPKQPKALSECEDFPKPRPLNEYKGFEPPPGKKSDIARVGADISPEDFFRDYVAARKPVVLTGHPRDPSWSGHRWTNRYLRDKAGHAEVIVERRASAKGSGFGLTAPKVDMKYGDFLTEIDKGNGRLYLTTQDLDRFESEMDEIGMPYSVMAEPLRSFSDNFPVRPLLFGHLIPYQLSLWQGNAAEGTSSGLHHDFHDNLYILLRGRKRFRLFPPSAAPFMQTAGRLAKIHTNGLVVYRNKPDDPIPHVRADGVPMGFAARLKREEVEAQLAEAEERLEEVRESTELTEEERRSQMDALHRVIAECEDRIDLAMEDMLTYDGGSGDSDSDCQIIGTSCAFEDITDSDSDAPEPRPKKLKVSPITRDSACVSSACVSSACVSGTRPCEGDKTPDHFCGINFPLDSDDPAVVFRDHPSAIEKGYMVCELNAGEMLYLPSSWFHEVTSYPGHHAPPAPEANGHGTGGTPEPDGQGTGSTTEPNGHLQPPDACTQDVGHLAFNYWMFPPDNDQFDQPYVDNFWPRRWESIQASGVSWNSPGVAGVPVVMRTEEEEEAESERQQSRREPHT